MAGQADERQEIVRKITETAFVDEVDSEQSDSDDYEIKFKK